MTAPTLRSVSAVHALLTAYKCVPCALQIRLACSVSEYENELKHIAMWIDIILAFFMASLLPVVLQAACRPKDSHYQQVIKKYNQW